MSDLITTATTQDFGLGTAAAPTAGTFQAPLTPAQEPIVRGPSGLPWAEGPQATDYIAPAAPAIDYTAQPQEYELPREAPQQAPQATGNVWLDGQATRKDLHAVTSALYAIHGERLHEMHPLAGGLHEALTAQHHLSMSDRPDAPGASIVAMQRMTSAPTQKEIDAVYASFQETVLGTEGRALGRFAPNSPEARNLVAFGVGGDAAYRTPAQRDFAAWAHGKSMQILAQASPAPQIQPQQPVGAVGKEVYAQQVAKSYVAPNGGVNMPAESMVPAGRDKLQEYFQDKAKRDRAREKEEQEARWAREEQARRQAQQASIEAHERFIQQKQGKGRGR